MYICMYVQYVCMYTVVYTYITIYIYIYMYLKNMHGLPVMCLSPWTERNEPFQAHTYNVHTYLHFIIHLWICMGSHFQSHPNPIFIGSSMGPVPLSSLLILAMVLKYKIAVFIVSPTYKEMWQGNKIFKAFGFGPYSSHCLNS